MKFLGSVFPEKTQHHGKRDTRSQNMSWVGPFLFSSLGMATIFSFFLLCSTNPFRTFPKQVLEFDTLHADHQKLDPSDFSEQDLDHRNVVSKHDPESVKSKEIIHQGNIFSTPKQEEENCDWFKGKWVRENRGSSMYTNSSCKTIPDSKNCIRHGRMDMDFLNWRWKPEKCELPRFDSKRFLQVFRGKKIGFVGDSVARNHMESLLCLLSQEESPRDVYKDSEDRFRTWYFPNHDFTLRMLWTQFLVAGEERIINGTGSSIFDLQLDKVDNNWAKHLPEIDYAIISDGHWFFRVLYLHEGDKIIGCIYCNQPNVTDYNITFVFQMAFRAALNYLTNCKNCTSGLVTLLRTFSPAHFENGAWNTGGYCNRTRPLGENDVDSGSIDLEIRNVQVEEVERAKRERKNGRMRFGVLDVTRAMMMRGDGHPGSFWGNKWMKGYNDCVHWCMPGPIDFWNDLLMVVLRNEVGLDF